MTRWHFLKQPRLYVPAILQRRTATAPTCPGPQTLFAQTREHAIAASSQMLSVVSEGIAQGSSTPLETYWESLNFLSDVVNVTLEATRLVAAPTARPSQEAEPTVPEYIISSWFLGECQAYLTSNPNGYERLHLVTGSKVSPTRRTLERMVKVEHDRQSVSGVSANQSALLKALIEIDSFGHHLHGLFHSHPGEGAHATAPSGTDLATHKRHENGGYPLVSAICTRDGWFRFFSRQAFTITMHGNGVTQHEEHLFQIQNPARFVSYETPDSEDEG